MFLSEHNIANVFHLWGFILLETSLFTWKDSYQLPLWFFLDPKTRVAYDMEDAFIMYTFVSP